MCWRKQNTNRLYDGLVQYVHEHQIYYVTLRRRADDLGKGKSKTFKPSVMVSECILFIDATLYVTSTWFTWHHHVKEHGGERCRRMHAHSFVVYLERNKKSHNVYCLLEPYSLTGTVIIGQTFHFEKWLLVSQRVNEWSFIWKLEHWNASVVLKSVEITVILINQLITDRNSQIWFSPVYCQCKLSQ